MANIEPETRNAKYVFDVHGARKSLASLAQEYGADYDLVYARIRSGWEITKALTTPKRIPVYADRRVANPRWNPHVKTKELTRNCLFCTAEFKTWAATDSKYCSYSCKNKAFAEVNTKRLKHYRGANHYNWKGGVTSKNRAERQRFRELMQPTILARDNYTCQICDQYGGDLQVDHIQSWADFPDLRFEPSNCRTLCMACHYYVTFKRKLPAGVTWGHNLGKAA